MINKKKFFISFAFCILFTVLFFIFPQIDIKTSSLFFHNGGFIFHPWFNVARRIFVWIVYSLMLILTINIIWSLICKNRRILNASAFVLLFFAIGPGLMVNVILKNHFGRPRPTYITQFNGKENYQKPWLISRQCDTNCAFPAGEPSTAFALFSFLIFFRKSKHRCLLGFFLTINWIFFSYIRIAQGGHFLSDVLIGAALLGMLQESLSKIMLRDENMYTDEKIE